MAAFRQMDNNGLDMYNEIPVLSTYMGHENLYGTEHYLYMTAENSRDILDKRVEQQSYRSCMGLLKLADKYSPAKLEEACKAALSYTQSPSYKSISNMLAALKAEGSDTTDSTVRNNNNTHGITRGAGYYRRTKS